MYCTRGWVGHWCEKGKRGGGGKYRQYMHEQATNDFAAANTAWADYKANGTEQARLRLHEEGRAATQRHRDGAETTYGPTNRLVVQKNADRIRHIRVTDALADASADVDDVVLQLVHDAKVECTNPTKVVSLIRAIRRESSRRQAARVADGERVVAKFIEQETPVAVASLAANSEELKPWESMLKAHPLGPHATLVHKDPRAAADNAIKLVAAADNLQHNRKGVVTAVATEFVNHAVRLIRGAESTSANEVPPGEDECDSKCFVQGFCSCSFRGRKVRLIRISLLSAFKLFFPTVGGG